MTHPIILWVRWSRGWMYPACAVGLSVFSTTPIAPVSQEGEKRERMKWLKRHDKSTTSVPVNECCQERDEMGPSWAPTLLLASLGFFFVFFFRSVLCLWITLTTRLFCGVFNKLPIMRPSPQSEPTGAAFAFAFVSVHSGKWNTPTKASLLAKYQTAEIVALLILWDTS